MNHLIETNTMENCCKEHKYMNIKTADNGFVLNWETCIPGKTNDSFRYEDHAEVFEFSEVKKMANKIIELNMQNLAWKKEVANKNEEGALTMALNGLNNYLTTEGSYS
jgi:hypothetical protein